MGMPMFGGLAGGMLLGSALSESSRSRGDRYTREEFLMLTYRWPGNGNGNGLWRRVWRWVWWW